MKTTLEIDERLLVRVMKISGLRTRRAVVDFALRQAERLVRSRRLLESLLPGDEFADAVDPAYDVMALRERETGR